MERRRHRIRMLFALVLLAGCASAPAPGRVAPTADRAPSAKPGAGSGTSCLVPALHASVLRQVNAARVAGRSCGAQRMAPAPPLAWDDTLSAVAARHSGDMARRNYFEHASPEGTRVGVRATAEGYSWRAIGENIAGGDETVDAVMSGWMASAGHCRNIMSPEFTEIGAACAQRSGTTWGTYWTMVLGRRR